MANPHRGEVALEANGETYTLSFSVNAICELEDALGKPVGQITSALDNPESVSLKTIRALVWAGLQDHHLDISLKDAGDVITEAGINTVVDKVGEAFRLAFPEQEASGTARPRKAGRPTRSTSSKLGSNSGRTPRVSGG